MSNQAAWLDGKGKPLRIAEAELPKAGPDEVVIKNHAIAINPVDWKVIESGRIIQKWPNVLGCDAAGEVVEVGSNVKHIQKGDRVTGHCISLLTQEPKNGGFQLYSATPAAMTAKIPDSISFTDASVLPLAVDTAAVGLYRSRQDGFLGLEYPTLTPTASGKTVVVYGGSSSVGALAIQLAVGSGAHVIAIASKRNLEFCRSCGAREVFDYKSSSVVDDVVSAVKSSGRDNFIGVYDAISLPDQSYNTVVPILEKIGTGNLATTLPPPQDLPAASKAGNVFAIHEAAHPLWSSYITQALEQGKLKCLPPPLVVGKGLESVQKGCDENKKGVSAQKVVIEL